MLFLRKFGFEFERAHFSIEKYLFVKMIENDEQELELEEQFILRLPMREAEKVRDILQRKPEKLKKNLKIDFDASQFTGSVFVGKKKLYAYLKKFPTIIETYKTNIVNDKSNMFKTADICHILECHEKPLEHFKKESPHGYAPPMKNIKSKRFRKTLVNPEMAEETEIITKELYYLLSTDLEAASTRFELIYDENKENIPSNGQIEKMLFGHLSSSDTDSEMEGNF